MTGVDWSRVWNVYSASCEKPGPERVAFVEASLPEGPLRGKALELLQNLDSLPSIDTSLDEGGEAATRHLPGQFCGHTLGRFHLQSPIGRGGMGEVYRAVDPELGRDVAVKCIAPWRFGESAVSGLIREARTASALNHPGIVTVHEVIRTPDTVAIVMELVQGESLRALAATPQPVENLCSWGRQIAEALAASHRGGIVHRDIKPENLILRPDGYIKVLDFGLAAAATAPGGTWGGTVRYMAPEQVRGEPATASSDVFALGVVLCELAAGTHPFAPAGTAEYSSVTVGTALAIGQWPTSVVLPDHLPQALRQLLLAMLSVSAAGRPTAANVASRLRGAAGDEWAPSTFHVPPRSKWIASAIVLAGICAGIGFWLWPKSASDSPPRLMQGTLFTGAPGREGSPAFSPDGTSLAYAWDGGSGGRRDIYVRPLPAGDPIRLSFAAEDEWAPSWSPDGQSIVFLRQGRGEFAVVVVPAGGGREQVVGSIEQSLANLRDRLWWSASANEVIVSDDPRGANLGTCLFALDTTTGKRRKLTQTGSNSADVTPRTSPGGKWIAFLRVSQTDQEIHAMPAAGGPTRVLARAPGIGGFAWASAEQIVYGTGGAGFAGLWMANVEAAGLSPVRAPWTLESEVSEIHFNADRKSLAYVRKVRDSNFWQVFRETRGEAPRRQSLSTRADEDARFAADGRRIAFSSDRSGYYEVWASDLGGTNPRKLTSLRAFSASPAWSPDGRHLAFDSTSDGLVRVWTVAASGSAEPRLLTPMIDGCVPSWSRDGKYIYFSSRRTGRNELWRIAVQDASAQPEQVTRDGGFESRVSADGRYLYYSKAGAEGLWRQSIDAESRAEERVAAFDSRVQFRWWDLAADAGLVVASATSPPELRLLPLSGGPAMRLGRLPKDLPRFGRCLSAAADAESVLYSVEDVEREEIYVADLQP